ncbi:hypothetical protein [Streptomyces sp. NPDC017086]|uniref:hypothetical protein n=1 Tax=Streptomyces sp. NPDC017086 TaxID=3364976 RepID=UPI00379FA90E
MPRAAIETAGTSTGIKSALSALRPRGLLVLASRPLYTTTPLPTYHAIYLPGIRVLPIPWHDDAGRGISWEHPCIASAGRVIGEVMSDGRRGRCRSG